jgi:hypothetical protein
MAGPAAQLAQVGVLAAQLWAEADRAGLLRTSLVDDVTLRLPPHWRTISAFPLFLGAA